jgi:hypothetical protein
MFRKLVPLAAIIFVMAPLGASARQYTTPPTTFLQPDWVPSHPGPNVLEKNKTTFGIVLDYEGFNSVPKMVVTLYLPKGVHVQKSAVTWIGFIAGTGQTAPFANSKFGTSKAGRPMWTYVHLKNDFLPVWKFTMNVPAGMKQLCVTATARPVGIKGQTQVGKGCDPAQD